MPDRRVTKAYKKWLDALENMRAALTANPLVADPLLASAQVFEDIGTMMFSGNGEPKKRKRAKPMRAPARAKKPGARRAPARAKKPAARRRPRKS